MEYILASSSPRRKELLEKICPVFQVIPADIQETPKEGETPSSLVERLAREKTMAVANAHGNREQTVYLGADTVVAIGGDILGKPVDEAHARKMLESLSGRVHTVFTGAAIAFEGQLESFVSATDVEFYPLAKEEIENYLASGEPYGKAGSYGIQGKAGLFVKSICGSYENVIGYPLSEVYRRLTRRGLLI